MKFEEACDRLAEDPVYGPMANIVITQIARVQFANGLIRGFTVGIILAAAAIILANTLTP